MTDLWLISVPLDKTSSNSVEKLKRTLSKTNLASCCKFSIPDLKVRLFIICPSDEPNRLNRILRAVFQLYQDFKLENPYIELDLMSYVTKFQWDKAKYPTALPLSSLADIINKKALKESQRRTRLTVHASGPHCHCQQDRCKRPHSTFTASIVARNYAILTFIFHRKHSHRQKGRKTQTYKFLSMDVYS
uniref:V-type proton ATPase subunit C n=1 Tax=Seriola lalandi dorsalis TaxID=1841481 RepID=A0A3B4XSY9_SERLL